jgi:hypothetical protein
VVKVGKRGAGEVDALAGSGRVCFVFATAGVLVTRSGAELKAPLEKGFLFRTVRGLASLS